MVEGICIKVDRKRGEEVRRILTDRNLIDNSRKIISKDEYIFIPILRELSKEELELINPVEVVLMELPTSKKRYRSLIEALNGVLQPHLLAMLPKSFDIVGDIAIIEDLELDLLPYKEKIAEALMKVHSNIKTVLLKTGKVDGIFRIPKYEFIGGIENYETIHREYGIRLKVNLSKAYYSPRLATEHFRVASQTKDEEMVVDMFAGIGPFSIMIANMVKAKVYAIDINPSAIELLKENIRMNKLKGEVIPLYGDARSFSKILNGTADRVIMNLPGEAIAYLDCAINFLKKDGGIIHFYSFLKENEKESIEKILSSKLNSLVDYYRIINIREVKQVAPREWQLAIDFFAKAK
ncbi:MAG: class I SAM-dependent methyltransferase family protein [Candidatus Methanomethyliaceae archaeon]|nr:class I SAM-dependent methyltransferase family protein [Candidatus Methanomethyliaceae archaeon]